mmetsp:Transcript_10031/g.30002  ORF Transcript_10031/g.30002 Transcript_10031/m.30002 type:complete len:342 (-) Transcript_10031:27-1052(-)|eukprot:CAMPEP_0119259470 /NCGR_PEP_ID=MMETSP1329-20130426/279_1 /TAXON_ID=114041 /ORGANISM="Genus nov. species nov., Strain RCC1024" /LENGTH=341 /DNA_ID=CAMNT_0007258855 /DNA_START=111 /DNA_END=1136 /DNA_ORIENTATION=+
MLRLALTLSLANALRPALRTRARLTALRSAQTDGVTGTKFEEEDIKKNPQQRGGHQVRGMKEMDPETAKRQEAIREHQSNCPRLGWPEEIRTLMDQKLGFASLATIASVEGSPVLGFPSGSVVGFAARPSDGAPVFCFSAMSGHTKNLLKDSRASLTVTEPAFEGAADARAVFTGHVRKLSGDEDAAAREAYIAKHPGAFWATFGDFKMYAMTEILDVSFVGGFARAGGVTPEEYAAAPTDPCAAFAEPVMAHMNDDHADSLKQYVEVLVGAAPVKSAQMKRFDRFGIDVRVEDAATGSGGVLRVPFDGEVTERKDIKTAIVALSKKCAEIDPEWQPWAAE